MQIIKNKNLKWWFSITSCLMLFIVIGIFAWEKMSFLVNGVQIEAKIERDKNTSITKVVGKASNAIYISLNGREIFIDKDGSFNETIALIPGFSVVTIDATDKFGKNREKKFQLVYEGEMPAVAMAGSRR
ncbi:MAG: hypothetical protein WC241_01020 [Candidatus Paceibacterota bacterium]|jgi:hypothetical protein